MQLTRLAQIGELISSVAVLITLLILVFEIRDNTLAVRADSYGKSIELVNQWRYETTSNLELARIYRLYFQGDISQLDPDETLQLGFYIGSLWSIYESAYFARGYNTLGLSEWSRFEVQICEQYTAGIRQTLWGGTSTRLTPEFKQHVESLCGSGVGDVDT
jgi:hypothetical protein